MSPNTATLYLAMLTNCSGAMNDLVDKFGTAYDRHTRRGGRTAFMRMSPCYSYLVLLWTSLEALFQLFRHIFLSSFFSCCLGIGY
ncbi:hypothetical protein RYX36_031423 [Vicia faba]